VDTAEKKVPGRNDPCHCGSGKKYKQCHLDPDEAALRAARAKAAAETAEAPPAAEASAEAGSGSAAPAPPPRGHAHQPWKRGAANTRGFQRVNATRKVGGG
jgi:hypothetical protein